MNRQQARQLAIDLVTDCLEAAEADGFQEHEKTLWYDEGPGFGDIDATGFIVKIGDYRIRFTASFDKFQTPGARDLPY
jgi:hypothetical protein